MKIGIYLGYGPKTILSKEGLGRYLANIINNLVLNGNEITIACPAWLLTSVEELLKDFQINETSVDFIVSHKTPILWNLYSWKTRDRKQKIKKESKFNKLICNVMDYFLTITNIIKFLGIGLFIILLGVVMLPVVAFLGILYGILKVIVKIGKRGKFGAVKAVKKAIHYYSDINSVGNNVYSYIYNIIFEQVQKDLVNRINNSEKQDVWYSPSIFWDQFNKINCTKVINVPDLVTEEFPVQWGGYSDIVMSSKVCEKTIEEGQYFITYSQYVKDTLLIDKYGKDEANITVISHNINDLSNYITINSEMTKKLASTEVFTTAYCETIMQTLAPHTSHITPYISNFNFKDIKYIFYASQARPHKNLLNLVKAYEFLLRRKYVRVKLFLTCNLESDPEVLKYIREKRLQYDIIPFYNVSSKQLAALYHQAQLVVNPTLYEGGFPFTFGEGMSVGTPSVMSRIPQVEEFTTLFDLEKYLFDPYNFNDIAEKIMYGLNNLEELKSKQSDLYNYLYENFSQEEVGMKYENSFKAFIKADCSDDNLFSSNSINV